MAWNLNTAAQIALLSKEPELGTVLTGTGLATVATSTITDTGSGLAIFDADDWVMFIGGADNGVYAQIITVAAGTLTFASGTFSGQAAGASYTVIKISSGAFNQVFANAVLDGYSGTRPSSGADAAETGTKLIRFTKDAGAFVATEATNGINFGNMSGTTLQRAIDPATGIAEVIRGIGLVAGTVGYCRLYANDATAGASSVTPRADGIASDSGGGDVNFTTTRNIVVGVYSEISSIEWTVAGV